MARPNLVYILADDMGFGDVGCFNPDSKLPTPNLDRLAAEGVRLTDAHAPSAVCTPTRYGLLTGRYCWRTWLKQGVVGGFTGPLIEPHRMTVASLLRREGYATAWVGKWHLGLGWTRQNGSALSWLDAERHLRGSWQDGDPAEGMNVNFHEPLRGGPTDLGFDYAFFTAACSTMDAPFCFLENDRALGIPNRPIFVDETKPAEYGRPRPGRIAPGFVLETVDLEFTRQAVAFLERTARERPGTPFCLFLSTSSPHTPWLPPTFVQQAGRAGPREDLVVLFDWCVGEVTAALERLGLADETLVIVTSDNGPHEGACGHQSAGDWRGYKSHAWEGGHRVPFVARWPGRIAPGSVGAEPICLSDLLATCAGLLDVPLPADAGPDSYDISAALLGREGEAPLREAVVSHSVYGVFTVRRGPWKLIHECADSGGWVPPKGSGPTPGAPGQLYNLDEDPAERHNLFARRPRIVRELTELLNDYRAGTRSAPPRG
ncbi:MAG TPA: arylsulfatase [Phycisphaerae bacterium]|nr:arylsulfatase [Phycisphaerae bacterium]